MTALSKKEEEEITEAGREKLRKMGINFSTFKRRFRLLLTEDLDEDEYIDHYNCMAATINLFKLKSVKHWAIGMLNDFKHIPFKEKYRPKDGYVD